MLISSLNLESEVDLKEIFLLLLFYVDSPHYLFKLKFRLCISKWLLLRTRKHFRFMVKKMNIRKQKWFSWFESTERAIYQINKCSASVGMYNWNINVNSLLHANFIYRLKHNWYVFCARIKANNDVIWIKA